MSRTSSLRTIADILNRERSFLIGGHVGPDGDCLGCMCALGLGLARMSKQVALVSPDGVPELYAFLPGSGRIVSAVPAGSRFEVGIAVDCEDLSRLGSAEEAVRACRTVVEIDHHPGRKRDGHLQLVRPSAAAAGEIVFDLLRTANIPVDPEIASCLLTAIVTDTGSFRFSNVKASTLRAAAALVERGASPSKIAHSVYESRSLSSTRLLGAVLSSLQTAAGGRITWASISQDQLVSTAASEAETEGVVNYIRAVRGTEIAILFRECSDGSTRVSLRSRDGSDISQVARLFGGGGHRTAAGCTVDRPLSDSQELVIGAVRKWMGS